MTVIINTWERKKLFTSLLSKIIDSKHATTRVVVLEDSDTPDQLVPDVNWQCTWGHIGIGQARKAAFKLALALNDDEFMFLDNDMEVIKGFDTTGLSKWREHRYEYKWCFGSSFRANDDGHMCREILKTDYILGTTFPGCCIAATKQLVKHCLECTPHIIWNDLWDWFLIGFIGFCIRPYTTFMKHVGNDEYALHK